MVKRRGYHGPVSSASWLAARLGAWWTLACLQDRFLFEGGFGGWGGWVGGGSTGRGGGGSGGGVRGGVGL